MYVIDLTHYLDAKGNVAPVRGPALKLAEFLTATVAHVSNPDQSADGPKPTCFKCPKRDKQTVEAEIARDGAVVWRCIACGTEGRISNWRGTFWDLSQGRPAK